MITGVRIPLGTPLGKIAVPAYLPELVVKVERSPPRDSLVSSSAAPLSGALLHCRCIKPLSETLYGYTVFQTRFMECAMHRDNVIQNLPHPSQVRSERAAFTGETATPATASEWISEMSTLLQLRWPSIDPARLEDVASDLWRDEQLRSHDAKTAARMWLEPVSTSRS